MKNKSNHDSIVKMNATIVALWMMDDLYASSAINCCKSKYLSFLIH